MFGEYTLGNTFEWKIDVLVIKAILVDRYTCFDQFNCYALRG